jgi:hypothetical protein
MRLAKREALTRLTERTAHHAAALGRPMPSVAIADPKARWGSCRPARPGHPAAIRYSWRLVLAPFEVADYVVAHECAHLIEANHGPRFWALCEELSGDPAPHRRWLRAHAAELQNFLDPNLSSPLQTAVCWSHLVAGKGRMASDRCGGGGRSSGTGLEGVTPACPGTSIVGSPPAVGVERG